MIELPGFFARGLENGEIKSHLFPFEYDVERELFMIGSAEVPHNDFEPYEFNAHILGIQNEELVAENMIDHPLMLPIMQGPIAGPALHEWIKRKGVSNIAKVMHKVFTSFLDDPTEIDDSSVGHMGFDAWARDGGDVRLQVFGNCACMEADPHSWFIENKIENGFAQYGLHNADSQAQRVSLYAGLGHLGRLAGGRPMAQGELF